MKSQLGIFHDILYNSTNITKYGLDNEMFLVQIKQLIC